LDLLYRFRRRTRRNGQPQPRNEERIRRLYGPIKTSRNREPERKGESGERKRKRWPFNGPEVGWNQGEVWLFCPVRVGFKEGTSGIQRPSVIIWLVFDQIVCWLSGQSVSY
jgi:hypothetical protein